LLGGPDEGDCEPTFPTPSSGNSKNFSHKHFTHTPIDVKLTIYKSDKTVIEQIQLDDTNKENVGVFYYDYTPASELDEFIFEFAGSVNNKPILSREKVKIQFSK